MAGGLFLLDTNVLIRWVQHEASEYSLIKNSIQHLVNAGGAPCYTAQNLSEFWNVLTRPVKNNGYELSIEQADARAKYIETSLQLLLDNHDVYRVWRDLLVAHSIRGVQVHDARLVAAMQVHGVRKILTFNTRDFARYTLIEALHPAEVQ
ncbi:type II toxin-antitoxin system VapC family toxin [Terracidiphilus sp.]|jgi:predicted nucleic acid-binding protein|uniref:type II toxin-antitoxin system VapC family toxin n=1 Tax=Terracidiphilus sp. TaxID=1964191 RepID=UPI003C16C185